MGDYIRLCEFRVKPECEADFVRIYGPEGDWVQLFRRAEGFRGTELLRDRETARRYVTVDRWVTEAAFAAFMQKFSREYQILDIACERLNEAEPPLGSFLSVEGAELPRQDH